ncbi:hypothetical protein [Paenibacillus sp. FSL H7-0331]|uniref:hypothetical protein n=1 Tax=Paenibacillus sp. FSL H7-0331 TaxID=1920421 RepID=UPI00096C77DB|nr:hypothetical protein [Paenibacillus sp. FSL H7-0331]OME94268.1 hypothetical protein BK127_41635 [Paenibacillus sp. FSL H7-0331]
MKKEDAILTVQRMFNEIMLEADHSGGFNEMDQTQTEFTLSDDFLNEVTIKGLKMLMSLVEECSSAGVNRKKVLSPDQIAKRLSKIS